MQRHVQLQIKRLSLPVQQLERMLVVEQTSVEGMVHRRLQEEGTAVVVGEAVGGRSSEEGCVCHCLRFVIKYHLALLVVSSALGVKVLGYHRHLGVGLHFQPQ